MKKLFVVFLCCLMLAGCVAPAQPTQSTTLTATAPTSTVTTPSSTTPSASTTVPPSSSTIVTPPSSTVMPPVDIYFYIYTPNETLDGFETTMALSSYPLNPNQVLGWLHELTGYYDGVVINSAVKDGRTLLRLDVNDAFYQKLITMGTSGEKMLVGCLVNTFLSAYGAETVMLTADGNVMDSGHVIYDSPMGYFE